MISRADKWKIHALWVFKEKRDKNHWSTNKAFMKKDGKYQTSTVPKESWNEQFSKPATNFIGKAWGRISTSQVEYIIKAEEALRYDLMIMQKKLEEEDAVKSLEMDSFVAMIEGQLVGIENAFRDHQRNYTLETK